MDRPRMRPELELPHPDPVAALRRLGRLIAEGDAPCTGAVFRRHAVLHMRPPHRHFFSPYLYLEARLPDDDDPYAPDEALLHGRFAPHPHVWTMFMATYGVLGMIALLSLAYGSSQLWLGWTPWALAAAPAAVALAGFVYGAAFIGQGLGAAQMYELRSLVDRALEDGPLSEPPGRSG